MINGLTIVTVLIKTFLENNKKKVSAFFFNLNFQILVNASKLLFFFVSLIFWSQKMILANEIRKKKRNTIKIYYFENQPIAKQAKIYV